MGDEMGQADVLLVRYFLEVACLPSKRQCRQSTPPVGHPPVEAIQGRSVENGVEQATLFEHGSSV
jgi:hypothetical protein